MACLNLALPKVLKYVIDNVFQGQETQGMRVSRLLWVLPVVFVIYVLRNALFYFSKTRVTSVGEETAFEVREDLIRHLHTLSVDFYQRSNPGKISARVMQDVQAIKAFIQDELANFILNVLTLIVVAVILLTSNVTLALLTMAVMPFDVLVYFVFRKPITTYARQAKEQIADVSGDLVQQFDASGAVTVKASATQLLEQEKFRHSMRKGMRAQIRQSRYYVLQKVAAEMLVGVGTIILFVYGGFAVINEKMTSGDFVAFYVYVRMLYPCLLDLVSQGGKFAHTATSIERVAQILQIAPGVKEKTDAIPYEIANGKIEFQGVSFAYQEGANGRILNKISFDIGPREHVLITGPSGGGKSTCVNLIARFYDPEAGRILIDGVDVRDFTLTSLRRQIGFVFQDCFLFNDTVMANIRYAWPSASDEAVDGGVAPLLCPRVHREAAQRLRHRHRRGRNAALGRPEAPPDDRPRLPEEPEDPHPRRAPRLPRRRGPQARDRGPLQPHRLPHRADHHPLPRRNPARDEAGPHLRRKGDGEGPVGTDTAVVGP